jgi:Tfp pilus assembly protein PilO
MGREALRRLVWEATRQGQKLGWLGAVGTLLIMFAAAFHFSAVISLQKEIDEMRNDAERLRARYQMAITQPNAVKAGLSQQLGTFYEFFPPSATLPDWLDRVYAAADKRGVALERGEYKVVQERGWRLLRYQINLPVKGTYEQIRGFVADVLAEVPAAAIDEIGLKREGITATILEAQVKLTVFLGANKS